MADPESGPTPSDQDDATPGWYWLLGLVAVFGFLGLTAWVLVAVGPR